MNPMHGFWLDDVNCSSEATRIGECQHREFGDHNCGSSECIRLACIKSQAQYVP